MFIIKSIRKIVNRKNVRMVEILFVDRKICFENLVFVFVRYYNN